MPLLHCKNCDHEWESSGSKEEAKCAWCNSDSYTLDKETDLSKLLDYIYGEEDE